MKKIFTLFALALAVGTANAQTTSIFDAADIDANGWLWFDTQEKIDKYVGKINEDDFVIDAKGKIIQVVYANQMNLDYPTPTADPTVKGAGSDGELGGKDHKVGAIILNAATVGDDTGSNGGGIALNMPSCAELSLYISCTKTVGGYLACADDVKTNLDKFKKNHAYLNIAWFGYITKAGMCEWNGIEDVRDENVDGSPVIKSESPTYAYFANGAKADLFIHGIKLNIYKKEVSGINDIIFDGNGMAEVFTLSGHKVQVSANGTVNRNSIPAGIYLVRKDGAVRKVTIK